MATCTDENKIFVLTYYPNAEVHIYKYYQVAIDYTIYNGTERLGTSGFNESDAWKYAAENIKILQSFNYDSKDLFTPKVD